MKQLWVITLTVVILITVFEPLNARPQSSNSNATNKPKSSTSKPATKSTLKTTRKPTTHNPSAGKSTDSLEKELNKLVEEYLALFEQLSSDNANIKGIATNLVQAGNGVAEVLKQLDVAGQ